MVEHLSLRDQQSPLSAVSAYQLEEWAEQDRISSAIPKALWDANIQLLTGEDALDYILGAKLKSLGAHSQQYITKPVRQLLDRYDSLRKGIWCLLDAICETPYAKGIAPRPSPEEPDKVVKYETAPGLRGAPIVPAVDEATATRIYRRYRVNPEPNESFWEVVERCGLPVAFTEGLKKALSLLAHGVPAIAVRSVTQWHLKGVKWLHPELEKLATQGRKIYVLFDQDQKPKTIRNVRKQAKELAETLINKGCKVRLPIWNSELGKGIDDVLYSQGAAAPAWLKEILKKAPTLKEYRRSGRKLAALNAISQLNALTFPLERETTGNYLPQLPPLTPGAIHVVDATMNTGKTYRIGRDWVNAAIRSGQHVVVLPPLNSLGQQTAKDWGIFHIHDQGTTGDSQRQFWEAVRENPGLVLCPDSVAKIPEWFFLKPIVVVLDEANQTTEHICQGDTFKSRYGAVLERVTELAKYAITSGGSIVLSEDGIPDRCVNFWKALTGTETVRCFRHRKQGQPWQVTLFKGAASGFRQALLQRINQGDRVLITTASQREAKRLERIIEATGIKAVRVDSETNENGRFKELFSSPDKWLKAEQPDVLILSPSAKSGVSIEGNVSAEDAYFAEVWGYFPALATDTHLQLLGRYRPPVPRKIFAPPFIVGTGDELEYSPADIKKRFQSNVETISLIHRITHQPDLAATEVAVLDYLSAARAVSGNQKAIAQDALIARLEASGHTVEYGEVEGNPETSKLWQETQDAIWQEEALEMAAAAVEDGQDPNWAYRTLDSMESSREARIIAHKVLWHEQFPGMDFNNPDEVFQAICRDYGRMRKGCLLQAQAMNLESIRESDKAAVESLLQGSIRPLHKLPKAYIRAAVIERLGVLKMLDGSSWQNGDKRAISIKRVALKYADEIQYWLRLTINSTQTPAEIVNKLLRKLGLVAVSESRPGKRQEKRDRVYEIEDFGNPVREKLLKSACSKLSESVSTISNEEKAPIQNVDTSPQNIVKWAVGMVGKCLQTGGTVLVEAVEGAIATVSDEFGALRSVLLSDLEKGTCI
jgi:5S rRNA maturation endonuclease (ribonuclease M5)